MGSQCEKMLLRILSTSVSMRSSHGIRQKGLMQMVRKEDIQENVKIAQSFDDDKLDAFLGEHCVRNGVILLSVKKNMMIEDNYYASASSYETYLHALTIRFTEFDRLDANIAGSLFVNNVFNFIYNRARGGGEFDMLMFPILDELIEAMKAPQDYDWRAIKKDGPVDLTRILLRQSLFDSLPLSQKIKLGIDSPASPAIAKMLINLLFSAIYAMAGNRRDFSNTDDNDAWMSELRCLTGLILSVMASGSNRPFSLVYQVILYKHNFTTVDINLTKPEDKAWLRSLITIWSWLKLDEVDAKQNAVTNVLNQLTEKSNNLLSVKSSSSFSSDDDDEEDKRRKQKEDKKRKKEEKKREILQRVRVNANYYYNALRPFVTYLLGIIFPDIPLEDASLSSINYSGASNYNDFLEKAENEEFNVTFPQITSAEEKQKIELKMQQILSQKKKEKEKEAEKKPHRARKFIKEDNEHEMFENVIVPNVNNILKKYKEIINNVIVSADLRKHFNRSGFFKYVANLEKEIENNNPAFRRTLYVIYSMAREIYLNESLFVYMEMLKLHTYLFATHPENAKQCEQFKAEAYAKLQRLNISLDVKNKYTGIGKREEIDRKAVRRRYRSQPPVEFSLDVCRGLREIILLKISKLVDSPEEYWKIHKVFLHLIQCETEQDYRCKEFRNLLGDYLKIKFNYGHFMSGQLENHNDDGANNAATVNTTAITTTTTTTTELDALRDKKLGEKIDQLYNKNQSIKSMFDFLSEYGLVKETVKQHCITTVIQNQNRNHHEGEALLLESM